MRQCCSEGIGGPQLSKTLYVLYSDSTAENAIEVIPIYAFIKIFITTYFTGSLIF